MSAPIRIATVIGARPQFIKSAPVSRALRQTGNGHGGRTIEELIIHTGQHYDANMSKVFFEELQIAAPRYELAAGGGTQGEQTGKMLAEVERTLMAERPDWVLVYGDTNSTLAGALAAAKLHIPVAHIESGLRSFNRQMPEEINRILTDHLSQLLFAPTTTAVCNLTGEGITAGVHLVGDVMQDAMADSVAIAERQSGLLRQLGLESGGYLLVTVHRAENTDEIEKLESILQAIRMLAEENILVWPVHPRTRRLLDESHSMPSNLRIIDPVSYLDMLALERNAAVILTDSGGVQKEARWLNVPCVTLREQTEWTETLKDGWNRLAGSCVDSILSATAEAKRKSTSGTTSLSPSGASERIAALLSQQN